MFKKAEKKGAKLKIALTGVSGSGKTYSALVLAKEIGKRIAVIDTENDSALLYADDFDFDHNRLSPPYTTERYIAMMELASKEYDVLIIDSISHAWNGGEGSILDRKGDLDLLKTKDNRMQNTYTTWNPFTKEHNKFVSKLLNLPIHCICTMRSKQDYVLQQDSNGRLSPKKVGLAPIQRDGIEYESTTVLDLDKEHYATTSKDRTKIFDSQSFIITPETGKKIRDWINTVKYEAPPQHEETMSTQIPTQQQGIKMPQPIVRHSVAQAPIVNNPIKI